MLRDFSSGELKQLIHLYLAHFHKRKGRFDRARNRLDKALASSRQPAAFILAFDGFLMVREDRLKAAQARFEECVDLAKQGESTDDEYVIKWCRVWLAVSNEAMGWEEIKYAAEAVNIAWRKASKLVQVYLPRAPIDQLEEICGDRKSKAKYGSSQRPTPTKTSTIAFDL